MRISDWSSDVCSSDLPQKQKETVAESRSETPSGNSETPINSGGLQREIELLREQLQDRDSVVADLRQRLDKSEDERREAQARVIGLLTGPEHADSQRGFFVRLFGDRKSVVWGKSVIEGSEPGGRRDIKKKTHNN